MMGVVGFDTWWATMKPALEADGFPAGQREITDLARRSYAVGFVDGEQSMAEDLGPQSSDEEG
jgi:hypothetical protein